MLGLQQSFSLAQAVSAIMQPAARRRSDMKFLVVDDHALIREAMRGVLKELRGDGTVLEAASAGEASDLVRQHPDLALILLDLKLPDRDEIGRASCRERG